MPTPLRWQAGSLLARVFATLYSLRTTFEACEFAGVYVTLSTVVTIVMALVGGTA